MHLFTHPPPNTWTQGAGPQWLRTVVTREGAHTILASPRGPGAVAHLSHHSSQPSTAHRDASAETGAAPLQTTPPLLPAPTALHTPTARQSSIDLGAAAAPPPQPAAAQPRAARRGSAESLQQEREGGVPLPPPLSDTRGKQRRNSAVSAANASHRRRSAKREAPRGKELSALVHAAELQQEQQAAVGVGLWRGGSVELGDTNEATAANPSAGALAGRKIRKKSAVLPDHASAEAIAHELALRLPFTAEPAVTGSGEHEQATTGAFMPARIRSGGNSGATTSRAAGASAVPAVPEERKRTLPARRASLVAEMAQKVFGGLGVASPWGEAEEGKAEKAGGTAPPTQRSNPPTQRASLQQQQQREREAQRERETALLARLEERERQLTALQAVEEEAMQLRTQLAGACVLCSLSGRMSL